MKDKKTPLMHLPSGKTLKGQRRMPRAWLFAYTLDSKKKVKWEKSIFEPRIDNPVIE